jgi:peroxiredoxin
MGVLNRDPRDPGEKQARGVAKEYGLPYRTLMDDKFALAQYFDVEGIPHTVIIDRNGIVRSNIQGGRPEEYLRDELKKAGA